MGFGFEILDAAQYIECSKERFVSNPIKSEQRVTSMGICGSAANIVENSIYHFFGFAEDNGDVNTVLQLDLNKWIWSEVFVNGQTPRNDFNNVPMSKNVSNFF